MEFAEERAHWRIWRIADPARPGGPLWFVPHDNENAGFEAGLAALRRHGGTLIAVDTGSADGRDGKRLNRAVDFGRPIDPNRDFHDGLPRYAAVILREVEGRHRLIVALHTNQRGYDPRESLCPRDGDISGGGTISIRYCDAVVTPIASRHRAWPFDDDDTLAVATWRAAGAPQDAYCRDALIAADWNLVQERVANSDGSLSNYAVLRRLLYLAFETRERGNDPAGLAEARDRLSYMVDHALAMCPAL